jgi:hypothetical protein
MNIDFLKTELIGKTVPRPSSGTLSGHAAGEPFDKHIESVLKKKYPANVKRQYQYLNELFEHHKAAHSYENRIALIKSPVARLLLMRGKATVTAWSPSSLFEEKQDDTADILIVDGIPTSKFQIIDVKTTNLSKEAQPPNIISAEKLANACLYMLDNNDFDSISISYIGIGWKLEKINDKEMLVCKSVDIKHLFKSNPSELYINWVAAQQLQFKVEKLSQNFKGDTEQWCKEFINFYVTSCKNHINKKLNKLVPFEKYLN